MKPGEQYQHRKTGRVCIIEEVVPTFQGLPCKMWRAPKPKGYNIFYRHPDDGKRLMLRRSEFIKSYEPSEVA